MIYRKDINGLRAIAVLAVMLFHFDFYFSRGGFIGVDVFFVITGYLMTGIIFTDIEKKKFNLLNFYISRLTRILPALSFLCFILIFFGFFLLSPLDYETLGKHVSGSIRFISNDMFWRESGYFDKNSFEKWLLHTWSLSLEFQFYFIYPIVIIVLKRFISLKLIKILIIIGALCGYLFSIYASHIWPNPSYYLLPTRYWEMLVGGIAYLYPLKLKNKINRVYLESLGLILILISCFFLSKNILWPGYFSILPVLGCFIFIQANNHNSFFTSNIIFQKLGSWSYSIYLWHWPIVVYIYYYSLENIYNYYGFIISIFFGFLSYNYIEKIKINRSLNNFKDYLKFKPFYFIIILTILGSFIKFEQGFLKLAPDNYQKLVNLSAQSPLRDQCHISDYQYPENSCEYFGKDITWAALGDSHVVEIAYALAERLKNKNLGIKHFSFSGCPPSYGEDNKFHKCSKWYNESVKYIANNKKIKNVLLNHRFTYYVMAELSKKNKNSHNSQKETMKVLERIDSVILYLASKKEKVYVYYPIPTLPIHINKLIDQTYKKKLNLSEIKSSTLNWYLDDNRYIIEHFNNSEYPKNVYLLKPQEKLCDEKFCYAIKNNEPYYYDSNHPSSTFGAPKLVDLINIEN